MQWLSDVETAGQQLFQSAAPSSLTEEFISAGHARGTVEVIPLAWLELLWKLT